MRMQCILTIFSFYPPYQPGDMPNKKAKAAGNHTYLAGERSVLGDGDYQWIHFSPFNLMSF
jgi:hypothetical protein